MSNWIARRCTTAHVLRRTLSQPYQTMAKRKGHHKPAPQKKSPLTHFLCFPLLNQESRPLFEASMNEFRNFVSMPPENVDEGIASVDEIAQKTNLTSIHPKAVLNVGTLHLTLGVMSLDEEKLSEAAECLKGEDVRNLLNSTLRTSSKPVESTVTEKTTSLDRVVTPPAIKKESKPLEIQFRGLESFQPAHKASVLYTPPEDETGRLYPLCLALEKLFKENGFIIDQNRTLKLHATIVNTVYAKGRPARRDLKYQTPGSNLKASSSTEQAKESTESNQAVERNQDRPHRRGASTNAPLQIDATAVLEAFKNFVWAEKVVLDRIAICKMGAKKVLNKEGEEIDAEYTEVASVLLPD